MNHHQNAHSKETEAERNRTNITSEVWKGGKKKMEKLIIYVKKIQLYNGIWKEKYNVNIEKDWFDSAGLGLKHSIGSHTKNWASEGFIPHILFPIKLENSSFQVMVFLNVSLFLLFLRLPRANSVGEPRTKFWLLYTFKVLNILFLEKF
jgi:hypothetical protein